MSWAWLEQSLLQQPLLVQPSRHPALCLSHLPGKKESILVLFAVGGSVPGPNAQLMSGGRAFSLFWLRGPCGRPWSPKQVRRAWQAPSREETWWGQQRFPSSRLFCTDQRDSFDLGGVTLIYLKEMAEPSPINSIWFMALHSREREVRTCSPQGCFGGWLSRCVFYCVYCLSDDRN